MMDSHTDTGPGSDERLALQLRAMAHPVRLRILRLLAETGDECCCGGVTECLPLAQSTVSQHIKVLLEAGLVRRKSSGTRNIYALVPGELERVSQAFAGISAELLERRIDAAE